MNIFEFAVEEILKYEGSIYTDDPVDEGGATKYGITLTDLRRYLGKKVGKDAVRNLECEEAKKIYKAFYWDRMWCDKYHPAVAFLVFDLGVNSGVGRIAEFTQEFYGLNVDKIFGPRTKKALESCDPLNFNMKLLLRRIKYYNDKVARKPSQKRFLNGWRNRANKAFKTARTLITEE